MAVSNDLSKIQAEHARLWKKPPFPDAVTYVRPSSLGVAEFCPRSADLNEQSGISRAAIISTAWHAKLAGNDALVGELHPDERKEVATWGTPTTATVPMDVGKFGTYPQLDYESAEKELHVQVQERDTLITEGTLDFAWVREVAGRRWAFVADLKRSTWAIPDGPDCLQLAAYGHAYAALRSCEGYTPGLWSGTDSEWTWGQPVDLTSPEALDLWLRLKRAARNDWRFYSDPNQPEYMKGYENPKAMADKTRFVTGAHCNACYGRQRCPEWGQMGSDPGVDDVNEANAAGMLIRAKALAEAAELITANVKAFSERGGVVKDPATGKVYLPTVTKGRESLDKEALLKDYPDATKYWKRGKPGQMFSWRKP